MISDQMLLELINKNREPYFQYEKISDVAPSFYAFARGLIALAQEIRPLEWVLLDHFQTWIARGFDYDYIIPITDGCYHLHYGDDVLCSSNLIYPLKDAAQADFNRRVLENLTHGVADEN